MKILKNGIQAFSLFIMKYYIKLKPVFMWIRPETRSKIKVRLLSPIFQLLYPYQKPDFHAKGLIQGVNFIGYPNADIGEGEFLRQAATALLKTDIKFGIFDYSLRVQLSQKDMRLASFVRKENPYSINIFHLKPDQVMSSIVTLGQPFIQNRYNIGYWLWELSRFPDSWLRTLGFMNEIWCPSRFIQKAIAEKSSQPILYMPPAIEVNDPKDYGRDYFKLPTFSFIFLFVFDFKSYFSRKNPIDSIRAFKKAFPVGDEKVCLVIKSMDGDKYPKELARLRREAEADPRILLIDKIFSFDELLGLIKACDSFISLHRSEGIGLCLAQSMLLGKPVIATNYSGNTDFTLPDNACLVDYKLIQVKRGEYPLGEDQLWAQPDVAHAANYMCKLVKDSRYRDTIAKAGQVYIRTYHNSQAVGKIYRDRLEKLFSQVDRDI